MVVVEYVLRRRDKDEMKCTIGNNGDVLASHHLFPIIRERDVFRGPRPDAVLGTPRRPKPGGGFGVDVSADDDDERRGDGDGDGWWWWEFRDQQSRGGDQGIIIIIIIVHVAIQRTRDQPSARVEQERFGFTDHGAVAEETVQVGLLSSFFRLLLSSSRREHHRALLSRCVYRYISVCGYDDAMTR